MHEAALGAASRWAPYFASLPRPRERLPMFWREDEEALLRGTELEGAPGEDRGATADDYFESVAPLLARHPAVFVRRGGGGGKAAAGASRRRRNGGGGGRESSGSGGSGSEEDEDNGGDAGGSDDPYSLAAFRAAASWVASRAFHVDSRHGALTTLMMMMLMMLMLMMCW